MLAVVHDPLRWSLPGGGMKWPPAPMKTRAAPIRSQAQKRRRMAAEDGVAVGRRDVERTHMPHAIHHAHVVRIIAAEKHTVGAGRGDQKLERRLGVTDRVVTEALEVFFRRMFQMHLRLGANVP